MRIEETWKKKRNDHRLVLKMLTLVGVLVGSRLLTLTVLAVEDTESEEFMAMNQVCWVIISD